jgi:predicted AlkP superfamily phosphohydrolase/phosphomutase
MKAREDHEFLFRDLDATLVGRERAVDLLWEEVDWDLFIVVVTGTDRLMHFLWEAFEQETHTYHQAFLDYLKKVDAFVGRVHEKFLDLDGSKESKNSFYMLSDHGFTTIKTEVYLNRWLQENGYLKFGKEQPETIMDIGEGSTAFCMDPSRIYLNLKGKYPLGTLDPADYKKVRQELKEGLEGLTFKGGGKVANRIYFKEELYHGPQADLGPDLVVLAHRGYDLKAKVKSTEIFGRTNLVGMHTQNDAFFANSAGVGCQSIFEAGGIILKSLT